MIYVEVEDDRVLVVDNQSERGTYRVEASGSRQNLTALTLYEYPISFNNALLFQIGGNFYNLIWSIDFDIEYHHRAME